MCLRADGPEVVLLATVIAAVVVPCDSVPVRIALWSVVCLEAVDIGEGVLITVSHVPVDGCGWNDIA